MKSPPAITLENILVAVQLMNKTLFDIQKEIQCTNEKLNSAICAIQDAADCVSEEMSGVRDTIRNN